MERSCHHPGYGSYGLRSPSGAQQKEYRLQVLARDSFLFARRTEAKPVRYLMIQELTWPWLEKHFGFRGHEGDDVQRWRERSGLMF